MSNENSPSKIEIVNLGFYPYCQIEPRPIHSRNILEQRYHGTKQQFLATSHRQHPTSPLTTVASPPTFSIQKPTLRNTSQNFMPPADLAKNFSTEPQYFDDGREGAGHKPSADTRRQTEVMDDMDDFEAIRPPYIHVGHVQSEIVQSMS